MTNLSDSKFFKFAKSWLLVIMVLSLAGFVYGHYNHYMTNGLDSLAIISSLLYVSLGVEEFLEKTPRYKWNFDNDDEVKP